MHRAEGGDDIRALEAIVHGGGNEIEQSGGHSRILDVQRGWESRLMARAIGTLRRPMEMMSRGQGASSFSFEVTELRRRAGGKRICSGAGTNFIAGHAHPPQV